MSVQSPAGRTVPSCIPTDVQVQLDTETARLFSANHRKLEMLYQNPERNGLTSKSIKGGDALATFLQVRKYEETDKQQQIGSGDVFMILLQQDSWGELLISRIVFEQIFTSREVFTPYVHFLKAFGSKVDEIQDDSRACDGYARDVTYQMGDNASSPLTYEFCYNLRYYEKNGTGLRNPWSLRQMGIYQKVDYQSEKTTWIAIQPSAQARKNISTFQNSAADQQDCFEKKSDPMILHVQFLSAAMSAWREYLADLRSAIAALDEKACFSGVGRLRQYDFDITFADTQELQGLRQKLLRCSSILESTLEICRGIDIHCRDLDHHGVTSDNTYRHIELYCTQLRGYQRCVDRLLIQTVDVNLMLSRILEYRNDELIRRSSEAMQNNVAVLGRIANEAKRESEHMARMSEQTSKDSKSVKALTFVATLYLPATFMATLFSSNLMQVRQVDLPAETTHLVLAKETWIYALVTIVLMAITMVLTLSLERKWFDGIFLHHRW